MSLWQSLLVASFLATTLTLCVHAALRSGRRDAEASRTFLRGMGIHIGLSVALVLVAGGAASLLLPPSAAAAVGFVVGMAAQAAIVAPLLPLRAVDRALCAVEQANSDAALDDVEAAITRISRASGLAPQLPFLVMGAARRLHEAGRSAAALTILKHLDGRDLEPNDAITLSFSRAVYEAHAGNAPAARAALARLAEPGLSSAGLAGEARLLDAHVCVLEGRPDDALALLATLSGSFAIHAIEAHAHTALGDLSRAEGALDKLGAHLELALRPRGPASTLAERRLGLGDRQPGPYRARN